MTSKAFNLAQRAGVDGAGTLIIQPADPAS